MSIVKIVNIIDVTRTGKIISWKFTNKHRGSENIIRSMIQQNPNTARTNVLLRGADGKFISYKNKNVEKSFRVAVENLIPFPKGV
ncbi:hypothetical protein [Escherichia phage vB_EcoP_YF01]|uniref:Uncharacterized protein n=1 Tax=Escherichia phage vB_EcoP_YF01 TaxID=3017283 RepID=A0AAF0AKR7_9CAUD|nr:hypothetical protein [Escherichia phage vB_EcoP_YF01]